MKVLLVRPSSMGDIIQTLPAITDAYQQIPSIQIDWVVEEAFAEIPSWHLQLHNVIQVAVRRWRKNVLSKHNWVEFFQWYKNLRYEHYDLIIDAQGQVKSAIMSLCARGPRAGLDKQSAHDGLISRYYHQQYGINRSDHIATRMRDLFAQALGYSLPTTPPDFGLNHDLFRLDAVNNNYLVFLHGTTWDNKFWPDSYWAKLAAKATQAGYHIKIPTSNARETIRAQYIANHHPDIQIVAEKKLHALAKLLAHAKGVVSVDTGLGNLSAVLKTPTILLYGPTCPILAGAIGPKCNNLTADFKCAPCLKRECHQIREGIIYPPCFDTLPPELVWEKLQRLINQ